MLFRRILCPLDVQDPDIAAVKRAVEFLHGSGGTLYILYVIEDFTCSDIGGQYSYFYTPKFSQYRAIRKMVLGILSHHVPTSLKVVPAVRRGNVSHCIVDEAGEKQVDLIVLSRKKRTVAEELLFHSVSDAVLRNAPCPVVIARREEQNADAKRQQVYEYHWMEE